MSRAGVAVRLVWMFAVLMFVCLAALSVMEWHHPFNAAGFGEGFAAVFGAGGAGTWLHDKAGKG